MMILGVSESVIRQLREKVNELSVVNYELKSISNDASAGQSVSSEEMSALIAEYNANLGYISGMLEALKMMGVQLLRESESADI